jgi:hypothetical protein
MYTFHCSFVTVYQTADPDQPVRDLPHDDSRIAITC